MVVPPTVHAEALEPRSYRGVKLARYPRPVSRRGLKIAALYLDLVFLSTVHCNILQVSLKVINKT